MLTVRREKSGSVERLTFTGHAGRTVGGADVCAMASTVFYALVNSLREYGCLIGYNDLNDQQDAWVSWQSGFPPARYMVEMAVIGFMMLQERYPCNIRIEKGRKA